MAATQNVTKQQISSAHRVYDFGTHQTYYQVDSATTPGIRYKVAWNREHGTLTCSCLSGQVGGRCWHKRAVLAAEIEYRALSASERAARAKEAAKQAQIDAWVAQGVDRKTAERVVSAKGRKPATLKGNLNGDRGFSLLK